MPQPPRKLLLVINHLSEAGGAETQLTHLAKGLAGLGHEVTLCCIDSCSLDPQVLAGAGIEVIELGARARLARFGTLPRLIRLARQADVVHCTMWDPSLWGRIAAIVARRPAMVADHATDRSVQVSSSGAPRAAWIALHNRLLDRFTFSTIACATSQVPVLIEEGVDPEKIVYIPNGVPIEELRRTAADGPSRRDLGLPEEGPLAVQVGVFRVEKNQIGALEAFRRVREALPDAQLAFVGGGPLATEVERRAEEIGAGEWAHFLGHRGDVPAILALADLSLLPSISDAMPMTILETMALGVPTVATDVGDVRRVLEDRAGVCVPAGDPEAFAAACIELLSEPARRESMASEARQVSRQFDASAMVERYAALFEAACDGTPPLRAVAEFEPAGTAA